MQATRGIKTTEFWLTAVANIAGAVLALLAAYGLVSKEHEALWLALVQALAVAVIPLALAWINTSYIKARTAVKNQQLLSRSDRPRSAVKQQELLPRDDEGGEAGR